MARQQTPAVPDRPENRPGGAGLSALSSFPHLTGMDPEFIDRLDAELASLRTRIAAQKKRVRPGIEDRASTELDDLRAQLERLQEMRRRIDEQSHGG